MNSVADLVPKFGVLCLLCMKIRNSGLFDPFFPCPTVPPPKKQPSKASKAIFRADFDQFLPFRAQQSRSKHKTHSCGTQTHGEPFGIRMRPCFHPKITMDFLSATIPECRIQSMSETIGVLPSSSGCARGARVPNAPVERMEIPPACSSRPIRPSTA